MSDGKLASSGDWAVLQQKIFTRWVNQKIASRKIKIDSVVTGFADGVALAALIEVMSEKKLPGKPIVPQTMRVKQMDNNKQVLDFILKDCGVKTEVPPSAENLADHTEKPIMGLIWGIMTRYLKFSDDDEQQMSAEDALLMWVNNQVHSYGLHAKDFTKSFHDGKIYAALIHKNRPRIISVDDLNGTNEENIAKVFAAANKYFGFEAYLEPSDIAKLDSKSGFVFTSEFYYGIAAQRKKDLAARRIAKVIDYTKVNDKLRSDYKELAEKLRAHLDKVNATLLDRTIHNTLAGAKAKLEEFYSFKKSDKGVIIGDFLKLESLLANLAMRLADGKRPEFKAAAGQSVAELRDALAALDTLEAERGIELVAELNRQNRLVKVNSQHEARFTKIKAWVVAKEAYLNTKEQVESSGAAEYQLNRLASYDDEAAAIQATLVAELNRLGAELVSEKYENSAAVQAREEEVKADSARLEGLSAQKNNVLTDDLARMKYKESIHLVALKHSAKYDQLKAWVDEKRTYLNKVETINSVNEAQLALSVLDSYEADKKDLEATPFPALKALGAEILSAEYKSELSSWKFENPEKIQGPEAELAAALATELPDLSAKKRAALEEDLKREIEKERLRLLFATQAGSLIRWAKSVGEDLDGVVNFGLDLDEVTAAKAGIDAEDKKNTDSATSRANVAKETLAQGAKLGVTENPYTTHTAADLDDALATLTTAQTGRQTRYADELARVTEDDNLCRQLAAVANPLVENIEKNKTALNTSSAELEEQAKQVEELLAANFGVEDAKKAVELQAQIDARGVTKNKHTGYTGNDVSIRVEQYGAFLASKKEQIAEQIKIKNSRGITPEQMAEIELQFTQFDKNSNKQLDLNEFKACLYSLGEEKSKAEVLALMTQYGDGKTIPYDGFKAFMVKLLGDANTQDEIVEGFKLLADDNEKVTEKQLTDVFPELSDVEYLKENAPKDGDLIDYNPWTVSVFSR